MAIKVLCDLMVRSLLDMLFQNIGTYQPKHTASHIRTKYSLITLTVIRSDFSIKPAEGNVKGNQPLWNRCSDVKCWILKGCNMPDCWLLDAGLLSRIQYSESPATGHLDIGFSWFPCVYKQMLRWFPRFQVTTTCFSCIPPDLNVVVNNYMFCLHVK